MVHALQKVSSDFDFSLNLKTKQFFCFCTSTPDAFFFCSLISPETSFLHTWLSQVILHPVGCGLFYTTVKANIKPTSPHWLWWWMGSFSLPAPQALHDISFSFSFFNTQVSLCRMEQAVKLWNNRNLYHLDDYASITSTLVAMGFLEEVKT